MTILPVLPKGVGRFFNTIESNLINNGQCFQTKLNGSINCKVQWKKKSRSKHFDHIGRVGKKWLFKNKICWQKSIKSVYTADLPCWDCITNQIFSFTLICKFQLESCSVSISFADTYVSVKLKLQHAPPPPGIWLFWKLLFKFPPAWAKIPH